MHIAVVVLACLTPALGSDQLHPARCQCTQEVLEQATDDLADVQVLLQTQTSISQGETLQLDQNASSLIKTPPRPEAEILHTPPHWVNNLVVLVVLAVVVVFTVVGMKSGSEGWMIAMFIASYIILIPGLLSKDFSFNIAINVDLKALGLPAATRDLIKNLVPNLPSRIQVTQPRGELGPVHESTRSLVPFLSQAGSRLGAVLMALFAFGMPALKLVLLVVGLSLRNRKSAALSDISAWALTFVQVVSKWAAPDMFAIILLFKVIHGLDHQPLIESLCGLDVGFTFYSMFCVFSVISTLFIRLPEPSEPGASSTARAPFVLRCLRPWGVQALLLALVAAWAALFARGLATPCLAMRLNEDALLSQFSLPPFAKKMVKPMLDKSGVSEAMNDDVSVWSCAWSLLHLFGATGRLNILLAALMLIIFVMLTTLLDMLAILRLACSRNQVSNKVGRSHAMEAVHVLRHISFMDVLVVGVITVGKVAAIWESQGIVIGLRPGLWILLASEGCHWAAYMLVRSAWGST